jgi:PAS domain S-box-containing protein
VDKWYNLHNYLSTIILLMSGEEVDTVNTRIEDAYEILERITDGFFAVDQCWNFTYVNSEAARLLFQNDNVLIGKNIWSEFPAAVELPFYEQYHKAVNEQIPVKFEAFFPPLNAWFDVRAYPSKNGLTVYFRDSSVEKMEETHKKEHYKSLFRHNPDAVFSFDSEGNYLSVNPAMEQLLGYSKEEYLQQSFVPLISKDDIERTLKHYHIAARGTTQRYETKALHKNGSIIHLDVTNMPIIVNDEVVGVYGIAKDMTESKKSQEILQNAEKLSIAGQLAAGIAHEIRNPITAIKGFIQLMEAGFDNKDYLNIMSSEIERIEEILSELLILAKPQAGKFEQVDINLLFSQIVPLLETQAILNNVEIIVETSPDAMYIHCDENQLKQVFINYIKNAIEAMPGGGKLEIKIDKTDQGQLTIRFKDDGVGMSEETLSKLGQPFYTTKENGTGLGFMISKKIIENHFGEIHIKSELHQGTIIDVSLPLNLR